MKKTLLPLFALIAAVSAFAAENPLIYPTAEVLAYAKTLEPRLTEIRRDLHRHPELGWEEVWTTAKIKEVLKTLPGIEIKEIPLKTGVIAELKGTKPELGTIGLRCDIDALPIQEDKPASHTYKSEIPGKMHACGHDGHITINLGAAMILSKFRPEHNVRFIFQPSEEDFPSGAKAMIDEAHATDGLKMIWGFHINATSDFGNVGWYDGIVMSGGYTLTIDVKGKSAHTAYPEYSVNPIVILSRVAVAIDGLKQTIRATQPYTVSMMHMDCPNVAHSASPEKGRLIVKTRYHEPEVNAFLVKKIKEIVKAQCDLYGATFEIAEKQGLEPTFNLPEMGPVVRENAAALGLPLEHIFASMGGDDFGFYGWKVPAYYMTFGLRTSKDFPIAHTSKFDWDERVLPGSAAMFASCALRRGYPTLPGSPAAGADGGKDFQNPLSGISFETPKAWPCPTMDRDDVVKAVWIEGEPYRGKPTRVFAYVALPKGASREHPVPGMVLAHGGAGTAYHSWVRTWVEKGYAVIAADNCASMPVRMPGTNEWMSSGFGGPRGWGGYEQVDEPVADQWPYHAVASVVHAHSYLRSLPEVDADRIGLTGISWGGFLTMLTASVDRRFKFAAPVYACAHYKDIPLWAKASRKPTRWLDLWEPANYVPSMTLPVIWFASTGDAAFSFDELQKTFPLLPNRPEIVIRKDMKHSHGPAGENMPELFAFADLHLRGGAPLPEVENLSVADGRLRVGFDAKGRKLKRADVIWTADVKPVKASAWQVRSYPDPTGSVFTAPVPEGAHRVFVNFVLDGRTGEKTYPEALVSSNAVFLE